jgi:hypothetical protein
VAPLIRAGGALAFGLSLCVLTACAAMRPAELPPPGINLLSGPVIAVPREADMRAALAEAGRSARCIDEVEGRAEFAALRARSPEADRMEFRHFADEALVSDDERAALRRYMEAVASCRPRFAADAPDEVARLFTTIWSSQEKLYAELMARRINWGEFNRRTHDLSERAEEDARRLPRERRPAAPGAERAI